jgi:glutamyl-Q tRNA(Asp) synthetase
MAYVTRFAPSPTGPLHLGHAFSALTAFDRAKAAGGTFLLRIEDLDSTRVRPDYEAAIYADLEWLGLTWAKPLLRQSEHLADYDNALRTLVQLGLCYPCSCTRGDIQAAVSAPQEGALQLPAGELVYPGTCRHRSFGNRQSGDAIRLNMGRAIATLGQPSPPSFQETGPEQAGMHVLAYDHLLTKVGDIVLARREVGTAAYHLAVVVDDARQGITEVTRGMDLFEATRIHVLLQRLLGRPTPLYHHHRLIRDDQGKRLAKRDDARALSKYRAEGATPTDIRRMVGL